MLDLDGPSGDREAAKAVLDRLAMSLGCSPTAFSGSAPSEPSQTLHMLNLRLAIDGSRDRAKGLIVSRLMRAGYRASSGIARPQSVRVLNAPDRIDQRTAPDGPESSADTSPIVGVSHS